MALMEQTAEKRTPFYRRRSVLAFGALATTSALFAGALVATVKHNHNRATDAYAAALDLASNRNSCKIVGYRPTTAFGKPALDITVALTARTLPQSLNGAYDGLGMHTTFQDVTDGNLVSGIRVVNETHKTEPQSVELSSAENDGPDTSTNSMTIEEPTLSPDEAIYTVYRQNAIFVDTTGLLVTNELEVASNLVQCVTFAYRPETVPATS